MTLDRLKELITLATRRNMVVYDSEDTNNSFTTRLLELLEKVMSKNGRLPVKKIFIRASKCLGETALLYPINDVIWDEVERFYFSDQDYSCRNITPWKPYHTINDEDKNLVLAITEIDKNFDEQNVLLGSY